MQSVLIIESEAIVAGMLAEVFAFKGWRADTYSDRISAIEALGGSSHYDAIVISYKVPGTTGIELARFAANLDQHRSTPKILITGSIDVESEARAAGISEIIHKPFSIHRLIEIVQALARGASASCAGAEALDTRQNRASITVVD